MIYMQPQLGNLCLPFVSNTLPKPGTSVSCTEHSLEPLGLKSISVKSRQDWCQDA